MRKFFARVAGWFTEARRAAVQAMTASVVTVLVLLGATSIEQGAALVDVSASALLAFQGAVGLVLLRQSDWYTWLNTTGRGLLYTVAGSVGVAGVLFRLWPQETASLFVPISTAVASILVAAVQMMNVSTVPDPVDVRAVEIPAEARESVVRAVADRYGFDVTPKVPELSPAELAEVERFGLDVPESAAEWVAPFTRIAVGVYAPDRKLPLLSEVERAVAPTLIGGIDVFYEVEEFRGRTYDVILVTVPLTRALLEVLSHCTATSAYEGQRIRAVGL